MAVQYWSDVQGQPFAARGADFLKPLAPPYQFEESGLWVQASDRADDGVLGAFFPAYDRAFVLPNEKEGLQGFRDCLALNAEPLHGDLRERFGPFREMVLVVREALHGPVLGGANCLILLNPASQPGAAPFTINLNYLFIDPAQRGKSLSRKVLSACWRLAGELARGRASVPDGQRGLIFLEVNDPFRLTAEQYRLDSEHAGIDQLARLAYWARMQASLLDWSYVQPALSRHQVDDDTLALAVIGASAAHLSAELVLAHLTRFFAISVLKGAPVASSASAQRQLLALTRLAEQGGQLRLLDLSEASSRLPALLHRAIARPPSLSAALKESL